MTETATMPAGEWRLRPARPADLQALSGLALRSKAHWGYDAAFLDACRAELTITEARLAAETIRLAENGGRIGGFYAIAMEADIADLMDLFVDPPLIGLGLGTLLWADMLACAAALGARKLTVEADPNAMPFYEGRGLKQIGKVPSGSIPGRELPLLEMPL